ncbi:transmembrane protein 246 [Leucoraja erinacea]|uniref:transmembrane protein 246 n=1 Tax=Leucoraja erinaceus TaxID=7782 RepID=UPI0024570C45|nr:transmembrane protein 246 [Leucoraja erinacea]
MTGLMFLLRRALRPPWMQLLLVYVLVLAVLLPLIGQGKRHSYYFRASAHLAGLTEQALADSLERAEEAESYFREAADGGDGGEDGEKPHMAVVIVTTVRSQGAEYRYYLQVAAALHRLLRRCPWCRHYRLMGCNVHPWPAEHWQAEGAASRLVPVVRRFADGGDGQPQPEPESERFEKEKADYLFCLSRGLALQPRYVLVMEDDALPSPDLFPVLRDVLERRLAARDPLYVKLYHPERLQGFLHPEPARIMEWAGLGALGGGLLFYLHRRLTGGWASSLSSSLAFCALAALCMLAAEGYGRVYLLEARRASPQLYAMSPASHCCTPAMAFTARGAARALRYLRARRCRSGFAKDSALYEALRDEGDTAYVVEPNLVSHIGLYSTLRGVIEQPSL